MANIAEQICLAIDSIVTERLKSINYDTTIVATVVDDSNAKDYRYICSNGLAQFVAFSKDTTFKVNDTVQVTIPNNDYSQQKVIIGKYIAEQNENIPYVFTKPFDTIIDVSTNLINDVGNISSSLLANKNYDAYPINPSTGQQVISTDEVRLWSRAYWEGYVGFNRLGIQGQFRSWIDSFKPVEGNYGYRLEIICSNGDILTQNDNALVSNWAIAYDDLLKAEYILRDWLLTSTPNSWYEKTSQILPMLLPEDGSIDGFKENFSLQLNNALLKLQANSEDAESFELSKKLTRAMIYANAQITEVYLDSSEMYGNPYNFQGFFEQEKVFDISSLGTIFGLYLFFYEKSGSFKNKAGDCIPYLTATKTLLTPNLFTKDPYICLGYDLGAFDKEQAILYTLDGTTYLCRDNIPFEKNQKAVRLRWLHTYENGQIKVVNEDSELTDYEVKWYRYRLGAPSADAYSGVYWESVPSDEISCFSYTFIPKINVDVEKIKAIVLYNGQVIRSNIITFNNEREIASQTTTDVVNGLSIWCEDNSHGNYFVYGQNNNLFNENKANEILTLKAKFFDDSIVTEYRTEDNPLPDLTEAKSIKWEFPLNHTMLTLHGFNYNYSSLYERDDDGNVKYDANTGMPIFSEVLVENNGGSPYKLPGYFTEGTEQEANIWIDERAGVIYIERFWQQGQLLDDGTEQTHINNALDYRINKTYNATSIRNTVKCIVSKDSLTYGAAKEMFFGLMGTNGTDATLVITFDNNRTALTAYPKDEDGSTYDDEVMLTARLYDSNHREVDFNNESLGLSCTWSWYAYHIFTETKEEELYQAYLRSRMYELGLGENADGSVNDDTLTDEQRMEYRHIAISNAQNATVKLLTSENNQSDEKININKCKIVHDTLHIADEEAKDYCYFLILQVKVSGWGDYDLITYKPIPIRYSPLYRNVIGTTEIIYGSSGSVDYYKQPYELWWCEDTGRINYVLDTVASQNDIKTYSNAALQWEIFNPYNENTAYVGSVTLDGVLKPSPLFTKGVKPYGVLCKERTGGKILWIQPIMIMMNNYSCSTLNKWDGTSLQIGEDEGYIIAPAIAAGKKNRDDGSFSGVMLGDWSAQDVTNDMSQMTGVYGIHHGEMSFAFKEDGTAFIGKNGHGRIHFKGNTGEIFSSSWTLDKPQGMYIDLDQGILKMQLSGAYRTVSLTEKTYTANTYWILQKKETAVEYENNSGKTSYDSSKTYYTQILMQYNYLSAQDFAKNKADNKEMWVSDPPTFTLFAALNSQDKKTYGLGTGTWYYVVDYQRISLSKEEFNGGNGYYKKVITKETVTTEQEDGTILEEEKTTVTYEYAQGQSFDPDAEYYTIIYVLPSSQPTETTFDENKYYIKTSYSPRMVGSGETYSSTKVYYRWEFQDQSYPLGKSPPYVNWNKWDPYQPSLSDPALESSKNHRYYILEEVYEIDTSPIFSPYKVYYIQENNGIAFDRYITLSAAESVYPLSIGDIYSESGRGFRVEWDGTAHINNGYFKGTVTADYLYCEAGFIGGWEIGAHTLTGGGGSIVLDSADGSISGGILRSPTGAIQLDGYFTLYGKGGYLGFTQSNIGIPSVDDGSAGIGMGYGSAVVKATSVNAGFSCGSGYASASPEKLVCGVSGASQIAMVGGEIRLGSEGSTKVLLGKSSSELVIAGTNIDITKDKVDLKASSISLGSDSSAITLWGGTSITLKGGSLNCTGVPKEQQTGIYARFA